MSSLQSVDNLAEFVNPTQATSLSFSVNMLQEMEPVYSQCLNLRSLDLSVNHLTAITNLQGCPQLLDLNLSKNQLSRITGLTSLLQLRTLNVSMNQIKRLEGLPPGIERLIAYGNQIETIEGMGGLSKLKEL